MMRIVSNKNNKMFTYIFSLMKNSFQSIAN